jgi:Tfp pilus assembly protein FimT
MEGSGGNEMVLGQYQRKRTSRQRRASAATGFTALELLVAVAIGVIMTAVAVPTLLNTIRNYTLRSAVASFTGAIQTTRYQAIFHGCPYQVAFNKATLTYQVSGQIVGPGGCAGAYTNVGNPIPISGSPVTLDNDVTLQFRPGGAMTAVIGAPTMLLSYGGQTETITVSTYGNIKVTP